MQKRKVLWRMLCVAAALCIGAFIGVRTIIPSYSSVMKTNWGISLPIKALWKEIYEKDTGASFHGDGIRYHVFSYEYEDYIDLMFAWRHQEDATIFHASYSEAAEEWLEEISVPEEYHPDYEKCFYWYKAQDDNSELIIFWDNDKNWLYVLESFL